MQTVLVKECEEVLTKVLAAEGMPEGLQRGGGNVRTGSEDDFDWHRMLEMGGVGEGTKALEEKMIVEEVAGGKRVWFWKGEVGKNGIEFGDVQSIGNSQNAIESNSFGHLAILQ